MIMLTFHLLIAFILLVACYSFQVNKRVGVARASIKGLPSQMLSTKRINLPHSFSNQAFRLYGKKDKYKQKDDGGGPSKAERQSKQDKFDAIVRKFMFTINKLTKTLPNGSRTILKNINLCFYPGAKIGIVGANGSGKSSLLKIMAGVDKEYDGTAVPMPGISIGYLPQEPVLEGKTVIENINLGVKKGQALLDRYNELSEKCADPSLSPDDLMKVMNQLEETTNQIDAGNLWELDRFKERAMNALRCPPSDAKIEYLSGGEKRRVALARLLLENHDLLLLDEPTNHLDAESVAWLEQYLSEFKGTVVAITHDRYFLENSCGWILELDRGEGIPYEGNYSSWLEKKRQRLEDEKKQDERLKKTIASELEWVRSNPKARQTKSKARLNKYEELISTPAREVANSVSIYIPPGPRLGSTVIEAKNVRKAYDDRVLINDLSFSIPPSAIVGVIGPNGAGKSTLIKMIEGKLKPDDGSFLVGETVQLAIVDQEREGLQGDQSVFDEITGGRDSLELGTVEINARTYCSWFGFKGVDQSKKVSLLSGGERNRCQLAKLVNSGANVLILDEPTNDLDVDTIRSLEEALLEFAGCVIVVSHDRYFLDRLCTHILAYEGEGQVNFFQGNYQEYVDWKKIQSGSDSINANGRDKKANFAKLAL